MCLLMNDDGSSTLVTWSKQTLLLVVSKQLGIPPPRRPNALGCLHSQGEKKKNVEHNQSWMNLIDVGTIKKKESIHACLQDSLRWHKQQFMPSQSSHQLEDF